MKLESAIVVGGGLAGCSVALALAKSGVQVTLLDARQRLGGRAGSFRPTQRDDTAEDSVGAEIDYCQHVGMGCCTNLMQLIEMLGQSDDWKRVRELHFYSPNGRYQKLKALPGLPAPTHLATWLLFWPGLSLGDRFCIAKGMLKIDRVTEIDKLDSMNARQWLIDAGQTPNSINRFWGTIIVSALGETIERASMAAVCKVMQDGFLRHRDAFHLLVPQRPLGQLFGSDIERSLREHGVSIILGTKVESLQCFDQSLQNPTVHLAKTGDRTTLEADAVVLATPWKQTARILNNSDLTCPGLADIAKGAEKLESSPISGIHTWWDGPWLTHEHAAIVDRLSQWVFHHPTAGQPSATQTYYQIVVSASRELPPASESDTLRELIVSDLESIFPDVRKRKLLRIKAVTDPNAVFSFTPGTQMNRPKQELHSGCIVAGDWVDNGWPATMEGAILSGFRAADTLLEQSDPPPGKPATRWEAPPLGKHV